MKILLGMSGGVDSTFAALKLKEAGCEVEGAVLRMHEYTDVASAVAAAERLGIKIHIIDCTDAFSNVVKKNFADEYIRGRTPNPCIICNREVKFKYLYEYAMTNNFDKIATGHYAKIVRLTENGETLYSFARAGDQRKDQTYMLYRLPQNIISSLVLPLAEEKKEDVKRISDEMGLVPIETRESQEICFIPDGDYASYIERNGYSSKKGYFVDDDGNILGKHKGIIHYTLGQRKGLGVSLGARAFVKEIDVKSANITLSTQAKLTRKLKVEDIVYSGMKMPRNDERRELFVKLRYQAPLVKAVAIFHGTEAEVLLETDARAVTPGQSAVFYIDECVACGGFISSVSD